MLLRLRPRAPVGQQPAQLLVADRLPVLIPDLPAEGDAAAQVGLGRSQRTDGDLLDGQVPQADGDVRPFALLLRQISVRASNSDTARAGWPLRP